MLLYSISKWFCKNQSGRAFFFFGLTHERLLNERTKAFFIPRVMLFVAPDGKFKSRYKISGAMKHNPLPSTWNEYLPLVANSRAQIG